MANVSMPADAYQSLERLRQRVEYQAGDFFSNNEQLRFDELLVELEAEARGIFETMWGDVKPTAEDGRIDTVQATDDTALSLPYPVRDVTEVEIKYANGGDFETLEPRWYSHSEFNLILETDAVPRTRYDIRNDYGLPRFANSPTWIDLGEQVRITYDRGFETLPDDIISVQVQLVNNLLRKLRLEQNVEAASPDEYRAMTDGMEVVSDEIRARIDDIASPSRTVMSF